ncbi:MAG: HAD family phosphatase [Candidatus Pacebacteria bacterium]|nr:HAD family phosphatase [Candidatus Paceibacterota bacterium]
MQKVAFFDVDGTVFRSSLLIELVNALIQEGVFSKEVEEDFIDMREQWHNREGDYKTYIDAVVATFEKHIKGVHYGELADIGRQVVVRKRHQVYRYTRDLITNLKADNYYLVAISHSPKTVVDNFCLQYGFDKIYGRLYEIGPQDRFTGVTTNEHLISNKANIAKRVFEHNSNLTMKDSLAVGDTDSDISLLESVDFPICFNPNEVLYNYALRMKWEVVVERKDVIYHL